MVAIIANIRDLGLGNSELVPRPLSIEIQWILTLPVSGKDQSGVWTGTVDGSANNKNQIENALRAALAAYLSVEIGVPYTSGDVEGITL